MRSADVTSVPPANAARRLFAAVCIVFALFHLYTAFFGAFDPLVQRGVFVGGGLGLAFWLDSMSRRGLLPRLVLAVCALAGFYVGLHVIIHNARMMDGMNDPLRIDMVAGLLAFGLLLVATRRLLGWALPVLTAIALLYYFFGHGQIGGLWEPPRVSAETGFSTLYTSTSGIFGFMSDIGTGVISVYVIFGALLMATGAGEVFVQLATRLAGRSYGGGAKIAVMTSALFGTMSGSAVANVMAVGSLTIPTMNRAGYPRAFSAGVEASASAGGQIMPPIMGAGAFLMAELLNIPYLDVVKAATIPAILYFFAIFSSVDLYARRHRLGVDALSVNAVKTPILWDKAVPLAAAVTTLIGLLIADFSATYAGASACVIVLVASALCMLAPALANFNVVQLRQRLTQFTRMLAGGLAEGGRGIIMIAVLLACAGMLTSILGATGLGSKLSLQLVGLAGNSLAVALLLAALLSMLLGMDVPTTASYVLTASIAAPLLTSLGLPPLTAHLFIFYFAILSAITPPVCSSVYAAAAIAEERFWSVAGYALLIAGGVYFIPFMLVYRPGLMMAAAPGAIVYDTVISALAILALCASTIGWLGTTLNAWHRGVIGAVGLLFFYPAPWADGLAGVLLLAFIIFHVVAARRIPNTVRIS